MDPGPSRIYRGNILPDVPLPADHQAYYTEGKDFPNFSSRKGYITLHFYASNGKNMTTSLEPQTEELTRIFPNPSSSDLWIESERVLQITFYNVLGAKVQSFTNPGQRIDLSNFEEGIYFVHIKNDTGKSETKKILIQR